MGLVKSLCLFQALCHISTSLASTAGCGKPHKPGYTFVSPANTIISSNIPRNYSMHVPYNYDSNKPYPLIFDFHANTKTPNFQHDNSRYFEYGQEHLVVYPAGLERHWQGPSYAVKGVNDLQFVTDLLRHLEDNYCVDTNRVYASGKSNGGGFVDLLACSRQGDPFAAFAMASAALYTDNALSACSKKRAILEAHGVKDTTIKYDGDKTAAGGAVPNILQWIGWWAQRDGCTRPAREQKFEGYERYSYTCNGIPNLVQHYRVDDLGHCWPSTKGDTADVCSERSLNFTPLVLEFFKQWDLKKTRTI